MPVPISNIHEATQPYSINKVLFETATRIKDKMGMVTKRLSKMEEHKSEVSESVYLKVKADYETQLEEIRHQFESKCEEVENELKQLYMAQEEQQLTLTKHEEILEEARFRHTLGELTKKQFEDTSAQASRDVKKYQDILKAISHSIEQYEQILGRPYAGSTSKEPKLIAVEEAEYTPTPELQGQANTEDTSPGMIPPQPADANRATPAASANAIEDDLDALLENEGDEFYTAEASQTPPSTPKPAEVTRNKIKTPITESAESIADILNDIPMEDEEAPTAVQTSKAPAKANIPEASLLLLEGNLDESEYTLEENTSMGRSPSNDLVLKESKISRQHAAIVYRDGNFVIMDLKSSNGIMVNEKKVDETTLQDGDEIKVGSFKFQFNLL